MADAGDPVAEFRAVAERYVSLIETVGERSPDELFATLIRLLLELYEAALGLSNPPVESAALPDQRVSHERWKEVFDQLQAAIGPADLYWTVPDWENQREASPGSLADDLADIYRDVKEGLELAAAGASENQVLWEWRFGFWGHWGEHAVEALRVIHTHVTHAGGLGQD